MQLATLNEEIERISGTVIEPASTARVSGGALTVVIFSDAESETGGVSILLKQELIPPPQVKFLAWGVVDEGSDEIVAVGRTDEYGRFLLDDPPRRCRVRYVSEIQTELDEQILTRLDDDEAQAVLAEYRCTPLPRLPRPAARRRSGAGRRRPLWTMDLLLLDSPTTVSFNTESGDDLPAGQQFGLSRNGRYVLIRCPIDNEEGLAFPYGVAIVARYGDDNRPIGLRLLPVARNEALGLFQARMEVTELQPDDGPGQLVGELSISELTDDELADIDGALVDELLDRPEVRFNPDLKANVERLRQQL